MIDEFIEGGHGDLAHVAWTFPGVILFQEILGIPVEFIEDCLYWQGRSMHGEDQDIRDEGSAKLNEIVAKQLASRRDQPTRGDVVDAMFTASIDGRHLTLKELIANGALLVAAGLETTSNALTSAYYWLAHHPDDRARLIADPSLMPTAVEELLRYLGSVHSLLRYATKDMEVSGHQFKNRGDVIQVGYAAANRDPREFVDAERCQLDRRSNRHLAFGVGAHRCLGSNLARMELKVGLQEVLRRLPTIAFPMNQLVISSVPMSHGGITCCPLHSPLVAVKAAKATLDQLQNISETVQPQSSRWEAVRQVRRSGWPRRAKRPL